MRRILGTALLIPVVLGACARPGQGGTDGLGGPADALPTDRTFIATAATQNGAPKQLLAGTRIELGFHADGRLAAYAGCNHIGGQARLDGGRLMVAELSTTEKACDEGHLQQDEWLSDLLRAGPSWRLSGDELILGAVDRELRLSDRKVVDPDRPLAGTRWVFNSVLTRDVAASVPAGVDGYLTFAADGTVGGNTGCNSLSGKATIEGSKISIPQVITTKIACDPPAGDLERSALKVLEQPMSYRIEANRLTLTAPDGNGLGLVAG